MHTVIRVYNNGDRVKQTFNSEAEMDAHLEYSVAFRFGCAHFRNNSCISVGYLGIQRCLAIERELKGKEAKQTGGGESC